MGLTSYVYMQRSNEADRVHEKGAGVAADPSFCSLFYISSIEAIRSIP